jgi:cytochrome c556
MQISKKLNILVLALGLIAVTGTSVWADAGDIGYRQKVMKAVGGHMGAMASILKGQGGSMKDIAVHAGAMAELARISQSVFPDDSTSMEGKTQALDAIWDKPDAFAKVNKAFQMEAEKLAKLAKGGDKGAIAAQLGALGKNGCKACHTDFREKKK